MKKLIIIGMVILVFGAVRVSSWYISKSNNQKLVMECDEKFDISDPVLSEARDVCYINVARKSQNIDLCDQIDESVKSLCKANVYYWNKTIEFCEKDDQRDICLHVISIKTKNKDTCSMIDNAVIRKLCQQEN